MKVRGKNLLFGSGETEHEEIDLVGSGPSDPVPHEMSPEDLLDEDDELNVGDIGDELDNTDADDEEIDNADVDGDEIDLEEMDEDEAALWFADQRAAESAYNDLRAYANHLQNIVNAGPSNTRELPDAPRLSHEDITTIANQDPQGAFDFAMENQPEAASAVIATVTSHAAQFAANARIANDEGDEEAAQQWSHRSMKASTLAEEMREQKFRAEYEEAQAPAREREFEQDLMTAAGNITSRFEDAPQYAEQIDEIIQANPAMIGSGTVAELEWAMETALHRVRAVNMDDIVEQKVAAKLAELRGSDRVSSKSRAAGAGGGRAAPAASASDDDDVSDEVRESVLGGNPTRQSWRGMMFG